MKAVICSKYGEPGVLKLREVKKPVPKANEVCMKIVATAVTASDCIVRSGKVSILFWIPMRLAIGLTRPRQPILGIPFAAEIDSVGSGVTKFQPGEQVFGWDLFPDFGAYAEFKCLSDKGMIALKPTNIGFEEAAAIPFGGLLAMSVLKRANDLGGKKILVYGASGAVGTSAVQLASYFGAEVTGVCSGANVALVRSLGASHVIDYTKEDFTLNNVRYDIIMDAVGKEKFTLPKSAYRNSLAAEGKFLSVDGGAPKNGIDDLMLLKTLVETARFKPVIDRTYALEQIVEAHTYVDQGHKKGNVVIKI